MAFIGHSARGRALWNELAGRTGFDISHIEADQLFATLHRIVVEEEGLAADTSPIAPEADAASQRSEMREFLAPGEPRSGITVARPTTVVRDPVDAEPGFDVVILKAALAEERERTTILRGSLDETRIALATASDEVEVLRRHRDIWAERAKALALALVQDPANSESPKVVVLAEHGKRLAARPA